MAEATGSLLSLPAELRECIYEYYLSTLQPTVLTLTSHCDGPQWTVLTIASRYTPGLFLVCRGISREFRKLLGTRLSRGPPDGIPLSHGPTIRIDASSSALGYLLNISDLPTSAIPQDGIPSLLSDLLLSPGSPCAMVLHLVMPQSPVDFTRFMHMLRFVVAVCNARRTPLRWLRVIRDPVTGPGWAPDIDMVAAEVAGIKRESLEWRNWYRPWYAPTPQAVGRSCDAECKELSVDEAWQEVLNSTSAHSSETQ